MHRVLLTLAIAVALSACAETETSLVKKAARIHKAACTIDSHTDTPLELTHPGFDFMEKNNSPRSKVDLPRMKEGGLDGIWFAVFVGQGQRTPEGNLAARDEAMMICDTVDALVKPLPRGAGNCHQGGRPEAYFPKREAGHLPGYGEWLSPW